jgi:chromosome segregation ATPase
VADNPKPKDGSKSGIQFFRIDPEGDIAPAFPKRPREPAAPASKDQPSGTFARLEPVFRVEVEPEQGPAESLKVEPGNPAVQQQLDRLQPQIDSINRISPRDELSSDQVEILRKYITLKEAEARDLKDQHRQYQTFLKKITQQLETSTRRSRDLLSELEVLKRREEKAREEARESKAKAQEELALLRNDYEERLKKSGNFESEAQDLQRRREEWKEKVREDLKRIKLKERELENKYELLKRDTQALLDSKDKHVLELKKKSDALELEMETLEQRLRRSNVVLTGIEGKKKRLIETMKLAISLLEELDAVDPKADDDGDVPSEDP